MIGYAMRFVACATTLAACGAEQRPAPAPTNMDGGVVSTPGTGRSDGGTSGDSGDGSADADGSGLPSGCRSATPGNEANLVQGGLPRSFSPGRAYVGWVTVPTCSPATLVIGISDGSCVPGEGSQLTFQIPRAAIGTSVFAGINVIRPEPGELIGVRLIADGTNPSSRSFGSCPGSGGSITFDDLGGIAGDPLTGSFDLLLTDCSGGATNPVNVDGTFDVLLADNYEDVCPGSD